MGESAFLSLRLMVWVATTRLCLSSTAACRLYDTSMTWPWTSKDLASWSVVLICGSYWLWVVLLRFHSAVCFVASVQFFVEYWVLCCSFLDRHCGLNPLDSLGFCFDILFMFIDFLLIVIRLLAVVRSWFSAINSDGLPCY